ncbi:hypothetical protein [Terriglobus roseus]|uniref:Uncharacterized protein n=1 Tax=Terriglobus roseus TaxID=392734 RepID=A0A1G7QQB7_9BACT|nr:hypothetical protein [Terriglobus roseus]SDG00736.1 hypothetical protein SAMN05444167_3959 [Terriglobus roseus]
MGNAVQFQDKFVAFVDVLGFKQLVVKAENNGDTTLGQVLAILEESGERKHRERLEKSGARICPESHHVSRDLSFRVTQISDSLIVSCEVSPAGLIQLINHCWVLVMQLMRLGVMCRGYVTRGPICHEDNRLVGTGYHRAYENEAGVSAFKRTAEERGTPFVEIDRNVTKYVAIHGDWCLGEMFKRMTKNDGELTALFPFQALSHSFTISAFAKFDAAQEQKSNNNVRKWLTDMKTSVESLVDRSNPSALQKAEHYLAALDAQLLICDKTDVFLNNLGRPLSFGKSS